MFQIWDETEATKVPKEQSVVFHHVVAQLLFMTDRARRDIQNAMTFSTRVKGLDEDGQGKLKGS